jgi:hypothetical protein
MADSVLFNPASSERIECNMGGWAGTGAFTMACVFKHTTGTDQGICGGHSGAFNIGLAMNMDSSGNVTLESNAGGTFDTGSPITTANDWVILAIRKASGSSTPNIHIYRDPSWRDAAMGSAVANSTSMTGFVIGALDPGESYINGNILIAAVWDSDIGSTAVHNLTGGYQAWIDAAPKEGIRVNAVTGLASFAAGGTMSETGHTGGTVDTGDIPTWWNDTLGPAPEGPPLIVTRSGTIYR